MTPADAKDLAREVRDRTRISNDGDCAVFVGNDGCPFLTPGHGPKFESNVFRFPNGLIGTYDSHARLRDILSDVLEI